MNEEQILRGRLSDLAKRAYNQNVYTFSNFLSISELSVYDELKSEISYIQSDTFGGHELAERQVVRFGSEQDFGYDGSYPVSIIMVTPLIEKFSDTLTHRDYLGALMNLGIERNTIGDILIKNKTAYICCLESISEYIISEFTKVKHTSIMCKLVSEEIPELKPTLVDVEFPVASLRLDGIIANLIKCSRNEALRLFEDKKVTLNGRLTGRNSILLKDGDIFSVRGHGKYIFICANGTTKKGKTYVHIQKYV